ncbi:HpcH/HpaI aldolase/citrate lyase family protein [Roseococcus microcysteis]|uniref:HpcH/HpaI aldolase/citrate lyase family protein n=1 Tax=Roseococcus microcysteis TaxID=2771361 RepID=UPI00168A802B|nr:CoA ester lyase [Roseococcus microcysteis]
MNRIWRSMLYVPANVPRFVAKSATSGADAVLLDLEDSVPADRKAEARTALAEAVPTARGGGADVLVRVNRPLSIAVGDIEAAIAAGADGILLTKALGPDHVQLTAEMLAAAPRPMRMIVMIETAAALPRMAEMARASPLVAGLLIGAEDLAAEIGAAPDDEIIALAKRQMVLAAVAAGVAPLGTLGTVADYRDTEKLRALVARSRRAGLVGASCIHPTVVPILNEGFSPSAAEVDLARRQLAAAEEAAREGRGSFVVDGMMVDEPILIRARRTLALAGG